VKEHTPTSAEADEQRRRAEARLKERKKTEAARPQTAEETQRLVHELQVHQIELEMQNEELRRTRAEVEASQERYRNFYEFAPVGYFTLDREGTIRQVNLTGARLLGMERSKLVSCRFGLFVSHDSRPTFNALLDKVFAGEPQQSCELTLPKEGNQPLDVYLTTSASEDGQECRVTAVDITKRKQAEQEIMLKNALLSAQQEASIDGILAVDGSGKVILFNRRFAEMSGIGPDVMASKSDETRLRSVHGLLADPQAFLEETGRLDDHRHETSHDEILLTDGRIFDRYSAPMFGPDQRYYGRVWYFRDVTERKRAEEERLASEARHRILLRTSIEGFWLADEQGHLLEVNDAYCRMSGYSERELLSMSISDLEAVETVAQTSAHIQQIVAKGEDRFESKHRRKDGSTFDVEISVQYKNLEESRCIGFLRDITERKRTEEDLRAANARLEQAVADAEESAVRTTAANRAKSEFLANMSHEIRTPMTAILGFSDLLASPNLPYHEQREFLTGIQRNGKALLELIGDILDLSRIEADRLTLENVDCPLQQVVDDILSVVQVRAVQKGLALEVDYEFPLPETIHTDPVRLRQVLTNLIGNAVKFTERGAVRISLRCTREPDRPARLEFAISDTGIGIPADKIDELFEPFTQVDGSASRRYGGTGLGLTISRRLAKALGGDVEITSQLGTGSTFTLTIDAGSLEGVRMLQLPHVPMAAEEQPSSMEHEAPLRGRVLMAEDTADTYFVFRQILQRMNLELEIAEDGRLACEMAEKSQADGRPYDLILMDIQMPNMSGYEATRSLRQHGWQGPIVAVSARVSVGDRERCLAAGCDDYIAKPITTTGLRDVLARYLGQAAAVDAIPWETRETPHAPIGLLDSGILDPSKVAALIDAFREELPPRAERIDKAFQQRNRTLLFELAHQLKGTAGFYGFDSISETARTICDRLQADDELRELQATVFELAALCRQAASGRPESPSDQPTRD
jgi:PAS domain S-box-containing protein